MKQKKMVIGVFLSMVLTLCVVAQNSTLSSGGKATGDGGTVNFSVGQIVYGVNTGPNGSLTEGVQQPYEISEVTGFEEIAINLKVSVFPNPTTDYLQITLENDDFKNISFKLFDINAKLLYAKPINESLNHIEMTPFQPGVYFLKISNNNQEIKSFKIVKNQ